jgi:hypothetical protein
MRSYCVNCPVPVDACVHDHNTVPYRAWHSDTCPLRPEADCYPEGAAASRERGRRALPSDVARLEGERDQLKARGVVSDVLIDHLTKSRDTARAVARMLLTGVCPVCSGTVHHYLAGPVEYACSARACGYTRTHAELLTEIGDSHA